MKNHFRQLISFVFVSGIGWLIDFGTYITLLKVFNFSPFSSNLISAALAITFVFFVSVYKIFLTNGFFVLSAFMIYLIYQAISIWFFSYVIKLLSYLITYYQTYGLFEAPLIAKIIVTPFTLVTNYLFMRFLTGKILRKK